MEGVQQVIQWVGGLGGTAVMVGVGWALYTKRLAFWREVADRDAQLAQLRTEKDAQIERVRAERDKWERTAVELLQINHRQAGTTDRAVDVAKAAVVSASGGQGDRGTP